MKLSIVVLSLLVAIAAAAPKEKHVVKVPEVPEMVDDDIDEHEIEEEEAQSLNAGRCLNKCKDSADGDYAFCPDCGNYISCSGGVTFERICPAPLEWDESVKRCEWTSSTCGEIRRTGRSCQRNNVEPNVEPLRLQCENGREIFVRSAFYGRKQSSERKAFCPYSRPHDDDTNCVGNPNQDRRIVRGLCNGKNSCEIFATNELFGNPCWNTYKYLQVRYSCVESSGDNTL